MAILFWLSPVVKSYEEAYRTYYRLLEALRIPLRGYPMTFSLYLPDSKNVYLMPPKRSEGLFWPAFAPGALRHLAEAQLKLAEASDNRTAALYAWNEARIELMQAMGMIRDLTH